MFVFSPLTLQTPFDSVLHGGLLCKLYSLYKRPPLFNVPKINLGWLQHDDYVCVLQLHALPRRSPSEELSKLVPNTAKPFGDLVKVQLIRTILCKGNLAQILENKFCLTNRNHLEWPPSRGNPGSASLEANSISKQHAIICNEVCNITKIGCSPPSKTPQNCTFTTRFFPYFVQ